MKKIKKIEIYINGKKTLVDKGIKLSKLIKDLKIPIKKVAIEINQKIVNKKRVNVINLKRQLWIIYILHGLPSLM